MRHWLFVRCTIQEVSRKKMRNDSLKKRYLYKVFASVVSVGSGAVIQAIIPRGLGAAQYGNFNFLTDFFTQFLAFLNMGTSTAFYTKLSKRPAESGLTVFYMGYIAAGMLIAGLMVYVASCFGWHMQLWPDQRLMYVYAAVIFAGLNWYVNSINDVADAFGLTVPAEQVKIIQRALSVGLIGLMLLSHWTTMTVIFYFYYTTYFLLIGFFIYVLRKNAIANPISSLTMPQVGVYAKEFYAYSQPLFVYSLVGLIVGIFDRWFLQISGGGVEQGFYSLSFRIGAVCFLLTSAMTQLITREFSIAYEQRDLIRMAQLFRRQIPLLYGITAILCCFAAMNAGKLAYIMGGKEFASAALPVAIMAMYPLYQTYGQLSNAVFYATDQTKLFRNISVIFLLAGVPVTYYLIAPQAQHGLGAGATGLAVKIILLNAITVNVCLYFNSKFLNIPFWWYVRHQISSMLAFLALAAAVTWCCERWIGNWQVLLRLLFSCVCYCTLAAGLSYRFPYLLGLERQHVLDLRMRMITKGGALWP